VCVGVCRCVCAHVRTCGCVCAHVRVCVPFCWPSAWNNWLPLDRIYEIWYL